MLKNYLLTALRNLTRHRLYTFINIMGFALGLAVFLLISLIVLDDLSYDRFHPGGDNVYRVLTRNSFTSVKNGITSGALTRAADETLPEIVATTRVFPFGQLDLSEYGAGESEQGIQRRVVGTDSNFFKVFPGFELLRGNPDEQLRSPGSALLTPEVARALFGDEDPIGREVQSPNGPMRITGIVAAPPVNSHLQFDILSPAIVNDNNRFWWESWENLAGHGYFRIEEGADAEALEASLQQLARDRNLNELYEPFLQPLARIHLHSSDLHYDMLNFNKGDRTRVVVLGAIALMTLLISGINFINLASARAASRAREVGMRKVVGASKLQLMAQFLGEAVLQTLVAMILAVLAVEVLLHRFDHLIGRELATTLLDSPTLLPALLAATVLVGLLAGIYPALVITGYRPVQVLKGKLPGAGRGVLLRKSLVVVQFAVSIALIAAVILVRQQLEHVRHMDKGFNVDQIAVVWTGHLDSSSERQPFLDLLRTHPDVEAVGSTNNLPGWTIPRFGGRPADSPDPELSMTFDRLFVASDLLDALEIRLIEGRGFRTDSRADSGRSVIINRSAARALGWADPVGRRIELESDNAEGTRMMRTVVGVVEDIHLHDARTALAPMILEYVPGNASTLVVRLKGDRIGPTYEWIQEAWEQTYPERPFRSWFFDEQFNTMYRQDHEFATITTVFSGFAILIAALGLFGLASFMTSQRRREIAIRKVLGSGEASVVGLLVRDFVKWVLVANLVGWPLAWFAMERWLSDFVYRVEITPLPFAAAGAAALLIAVVTVVGQAWKASLTHPARVLRAE